MGTLPKVYKTSVPLACAWASHSFKSVQLYVPLAVSICDHSSLSSHRRTAPKGTEGQVDEVAKLFHPLIPKNVLGKDEDEETGLKNGVIATVWLAALEIFL